MVRIRHVSHNLTRRWTSLDRSEKFSFNTIADGIVNSRDFQTTGVVAFARGCPFYDLPSGRLDVMGQRVQVNEPYRLACIAAMQELVAKL